MFGSRTVSNQTEFGFESRMANKMKNIILCGVMIDVSSLHENENQFRGDFWFGSIIHSADPSKVSNTTCPLVV